jgi:hypothetical protein
VESTSDPKKPGQKADRKFFAVLNAFFDTNCFRINKSFPKPRSKMSKNVRNRAQRSGDSGLPHLGTLAHSAGEPSVAIAQPVEEHAGSPRKGMGFRIIFDEARGSPIGKERRKTP